MSILWIVLFIVVIVIIFKEVKEGFGFDKQNFFEPMSQKKLDDLATKPLATYPRDSIDVLADGTFKPECCSSPYSNQDGCLCPTSNDAGLIIARGGNR
jgi:hypothetical protein